MGEVGYVQQVYDDGDLKVVVCNTSWTYNPRAVTLIESNSRNISELSTGATSHRSADVSSSATINRSSEASSSEGVYYLIYFKNHSSLYFCKEYIFKFLIEVYYKIKISYKY